MNQHTSRYHKARLNDVMSAPLPKFMTIKNFCLFSGFSKYQFWRFAKKTNLTIKDLGTGMENDWRGLMVDVQQALAAIEALPDADKEVPVNLQTAPNGTSTGANAPVEDVAESTGANAPVDSTEQNRPVEAASTWPNGQVEDVAETASAAE